MPLGDPQVLDESQKAAIELAISDCVQRFYARPFNSEVQQAG